MLRNIKEQLNILLTSVKLIDFIRLGQTQLPFKRKLRYERILNSYLGISFQFQALRQVIKQFYVAGMVLLVFKTFHNFVVGDFTPSREGGTLCKI